MVSSVQLLYLVEITWSTTRRRYDSRFKSQLLGKLRWRSESSPTRFLLLWFAVKCFSFPVIFPFRSTLNVLFIFDRDLVINFPIISSGLSPALKEYNSLFLISNFRCVFVSVAALIHTWLMSLCFTWAFPFSSTLYFHFSTFWSEIIYFSLHYIYLIALVTCHFVDYMITSQSNQHISKLILLWKHSSACFSFLVS